MHVLKFAVNELNSRQDLLPNISVGFVAFDDCFIPSRAIGLSVYFVSQDSASANISTEAVCSLNSSTNSNSTVQQQHLKHYEVAGVVGPVSSGTATASASFLNVFQIPQIGLYATSDDLSDKSKYGYFTRLVSPDKYQVKAILDLCQHYGWTYISLVYSDGSYGENAAKLIDQFLKNPIYNYNICLAVSAKIQTDFLTSSVAEALRSLERNRQHCGNNIRRPTL